MFLKYLNETYQEYMKRQNVEYRTLRATWCVLHKRDVHRILLLLQNILKFYVRSDVDKTSLNTKF